MTSDVNAEDASVALSIALTSPNASVQSAVDQLMSVVMMVHGPEYRETTQRRARFMTELRKTNDDIPVAMHQGMVAFSYRHIDEGCEVALLNLLEVVGDFLRKRRDAYQPAG